jgi:hypothetical protein
LLDCSHSPEGSSELPNKTLKPIARKTRSGLALALGWDRVMLEQISNCKWLYLRSISEPRDNSLRLVIEEARSGDELQEIEVVPGVKLGSGRSIEHDDACRAFEIEWESYISYGVTNESYDNPDDPSSYTGRLVRRYSTSPFLDYVTRSTFASEGYPRPFAHIAILCLNHSINVASTEEPKVRLLKHGRPLAVKSAQQTAARDRVKKRGA